MTTQDNTQALREAADKWFERTGRFYLANGHLESALKSAYLDGLAQPEQPSGSLSREQQAERVPCEWSLTDDDAGVYSSACGEMWVFNDGGPDENSVRFCQGCGKPVSLAHGITTPKEKTVMVPETPCGSCKKGDGK